jgi:hypothetical protein
MRNKDQQKNLSPTLQGMMHFPRKFYKSTYICLIEIQIKLIISNCCESQQVITGLEQRRHSLWCHNLTWKEAAVWSHQHSHTPPLKNFVNPWKVTWKRILRFLIYGSKIKNFWNFCHFDQESIVKRKIFNLIKFSAYPHMKLRLSPQKT